MTKIELKICYSKIIRGYKMDIIRNAEFNYMFFSFELKYSVPVSRTETSISIQGNNINEFIYIFNNANRTIYCSKIMKIIHDGGYRKKYSCPLCRKTTCFLENTTFNKNNISTKIKNSITCPICLDDVENGINIILQTECCNNCFCFDCLKSYSDIRGIYNVWTDKIKDDLDLLMYTCNVLENIIPLIKSIQKDSLDNKFIWNQIFYTISLPLAYYISIYTNYYLNSSIILDIFVETKFIHISYDIKNTLYGTDIDSKYKYMWIAKFAEDLLFLNFTS
jgi:hypothetical protein